MAKNFDSAMNNSYAIPSQVFVGNGSDLIDMRFWCDTVEDFESFFSSTQFEIRSEGLITYEKTNKRIMVCNKNESRWEWKEVPMLDKVLGEIEKIIASKELATQNSVNNLMNKIDHHIENHPSGENLSIIDTLVSTSTTDALSANQGRVLKGLLDNKINISDIKNDLTSTNTDKPLSAAQGKALKTLIDEKVDKIPGKQLSTEDFTTTEKNKLAGLSSVATTGSYNDLINKPAIPTVDVTKSYVDAEVGKRISKEDIVNLLTSTDSTKPLSASQGKILKDLIDGKVDKVHGKGLSTEDFTTVEKNKIAGLSVVATTGSYNDLANKPTIPTVDVTKSYVDTELGKKVSKSDIVDSLGSTESTRPLSANQGKIIKDLIDRKAENRLATISENGLLASSDKLKLDNTPLNTQIELDKKINISNIINNLNSTDSNKVLSAAQGKTLKTMIDEGLANVVASQYPKLIKEATHNGNKEIKFTSIDWSSGIGTTSAPHGLSQKTEVILVPNDWSITNVTNNILSIPTEYISTQRKITLTPTENNKVQIKDSDGKVISVNNLSSENSKIDATKFHFEVPVNWEVTGIPEGALNFEIKSYGYVSGCFKRGMKHEFASANGKPVSTLGISLSIVPGIMDSSYHGLFAIQSWKVDLREPYGTIEETSSFQGRRVSNGSLIWDNRKLRSESIIQASEALNGIRKISSYGPEYNIFSNGTKIKIYDLGGK